MEQESSAEEGDSEGDLYGCQDTEPLHARYNLMLLANKPERRKKREDNQRSPSNETDSSFMDSSFLDSSFEQSQLEWEQRMRSKHEPKSEVAKLTAGLGGFKPAQAKRAKGSPSHWAEKK